MNKQVHRWNEARDPDPRTPRRFIHRESIVVKPQTRGDVPVSQSNLILRVRGRLDVPSPVGKLKRRPRAGIELRGVSDLIVQRLMHGAEDSVRANFPLMFSIMAREVR